MFVVMKNVRGNLQKNNRSDATTLIFCWIDDKEE